MMRFVRNPKLIIAFLALVALGYFGARLVGGTKGVPPDFSDARLQGAMIAQNIVNLSNQLVNDLKTISELDRAGNFDEAFALTTQVIARSQEIRNEAVKLSHEVERMTRALSEIDSLEARQAALESISNRLALINRLINYSGYIGQLLDSLRDHFSGRVSSGKVSLLVDQINAEVTAINSFNSQAGQAMDRFDRIIDE